VTPKEIDGAQEKGFEGELIARLSQAIVGLPVGEKQTIEVKAENLPEQQKGVWLIKMARVRTRVKEMHFTPEEYESKTGNKPEVGRKFTFDPALPGRVESVTDKEVIVRFSGENGKEVSTPLGKGVIVERPDHYDIVVDAKPGSLIRSGELIGRVLTADDRDITIDFGNPFGGESLKCDVLIESAQPGTEEKTPAGEKVSAKNE
jgi:FKBP-type peptidyl-prolyl cis-trans isomerase 2